MSTTSRASHAPCRGSRISIIRNVFGSFIIASRFLVTSRLRIAGNLEAGRNNQFRSLAVFEDPAGWGLRRRIANVVVPSVLTVCDVKLEGRGFIPGGRRQQRKKEKPILTDLIASSSSASSPLTFVNRRYSQATCI